MELHPLKADARLDTSRETEILQSFVRASLDEGDEKPAPRVVHQEAASCSRSSPGNTKSSGGKQMQKKALLKRRMRRGPKPEELYTDKDRAAAVNMGTKDIKQSLKLKRQQDRSRALQIPEEADSSTFLALGNYEMNKGETTIALDHISKALELNPIDKNALVARSKCHILLGQPENALKDAESALNLDKKFLKAVYQKAESLYYLGDFEHALMYFHRGLHVRPDNEDFKLGVEKAQKAIETALGIGTKKSNASRSQTPSRMKSATPQRAKSVGPERSSRCSTTSSKSKASRESRLLRELAVDKQYLDSLLINPDIKCRHKESDKADPVMEYIQEAVDYLNKRQEFWRQQLPPLNARK